MFRYTLTCRLPESLYDYLLLICFAPGCKVAWVDAPIASRAHRYLWILQYPFLNLLFYVGHIKYYDDFLILMNIILSFYWGWSSKRRKTKQRNPSSAQIHYVGDSTRLTRLWWVGLWDACLSLRSISWLYRLSWIWRRAAWGPKVASSLRT